MGCRVIKAYFANSVTDVISVNLNNALQGHKVKARTLVPGESGDLVRVWAVSFPIAAFPGRDQFGASDGQTNSVTIIYKRQAEPRRFEITVSTLTGQDLYFFVFGNRIVGQNVAGTSRGIKISVLETVKRQIQ